MQIKLFLSVLFFIIIFSCISNDRFIIKSLTNSEKAELVTQKGIKKYNLELTGRENLEAIPEIRKYFLIALDYNSENKTAIRYLKKVNSFAGRQVEDYIQTAKKYMARPKKRTQDKFNICYYIQKALEIDPKNSTARDLKKQVADTYEQLVNMYIGEGEELKAKLRNAKKGKRRNLLVLQCLDKYGRALLLDPDNMKAKTAKKEFEQKVIEIMDEYITDTALKIKAKKYPAALKNINTLWKFSFKTDNIFHDEIKNLEYRIYYSWAVQYYHDNRLELAESKLKQASSIIETRTAANMLSKIKARKITLQAEQSFETVILEIDELIKEGELVYAHNKIQDNLKIINDQAKKAQLKKRAVKLKKDIPELYTKAVSNYNEDDFKKAINKFEIIHTLEPDFKDTANYLEKAKKQQEMLESF